MLFQLVQTCQECTVCAYNDASIEENKKRKESNNFAILSFRKRDENIP